MSVDKTAAEEHEKSKYVGIFTCKEARYKGYGHTNHGKGALKIVVNQKPETKVESLVDLGCGHNEFCGMVKGQLKDIRAIGVDFACPSADVNASATELPFKDKEFDMLTSFDMMEHLLPDQVDKVLAECARVSKRFIFSISHVKSVIEWKGENLHPTVHSEEWWIMRIMHHGGYNIRKQDKYITGEWWPVPDLDKKARYILVGNGPSITRKRLGHVIDSFDEVIRFNTYHTEPEFAPHTGTKTTIWSTFGRGTFPATDERPQRIIHIHGEGSKGAYDVEKTYCLHKWFYGYLRQTVQRVNEFVLGLNGDGAHVFPERELIPSSGLLVSSWLLRVIGIESLTLTGFDHFSKRNSNQHHYWIPRAFGKPREHSGEVENLLFSQLEEAGRIAYL